MYNGATGYDFDWRQIIEEIFDPDPTIERRRRARHDAPRTLTHPRIEKRQSALDQRHS